MTQKTVLLDGNVLIALSDASHVHHAAAERWFAALKAPFATCPITQGTLLRLGLQLGAFSTIESAADYLRALSAHPRHRFWPAELDYLKVSWKGVIGQRQVTDSYLAALARERKGRLATFDEGLAMLQADVAELIALK